MPLQKSKDLDEWKNHITTNVSVDGQTGCWIWKKTTRKDGYGITWYNGTTDYIHRVSYKIFKGDFDSNFVVRHTCDNPSCVNPNHLLLGSDQDNSTDMVNRNRSIKGSQVHNAKLTEELIPIIRSSNKSSRKLGVEFGVSKSIILAVKNNRTWKHV